VAHAEIRITHVPRRFSIRHWARLIVALSGDFSIDLKDGTRLDGSFQAKLKNPKTLFVCE
jgi:hypothetical protein